MRVDEAIPCLVDSKWRDMEVSISIKGEMRFLLLEDLRVQIVELEQKLDEMRASL